MTTNLFGPNRERVGCETDKWAVWILGMDDLHPQKKLVDALEFAAEHNAMFASLRLQSDSEYDPVLYAVVLHWGYAWNTAVEHSFGLDCGHPKCGPCSFKRAFPKCVRCGDENGPFARQAEGLICEDHLVAGTEQ